MHFEDSLEILRRPTRKVKVGQITMGGDSPISIQTMAKTKTDDVKATVEQILQIQQAGADLVRVAVPDEPSARALKHIRLNIQIPLVADIHFNHKYAMIALEGGIDKLRLNPGNIRNEAKIRDIVRAAKERSVPIRIGVNAGSLDPDIKAKWGMTPRAIVESAKRELSYFDKEDFQDVVISLKASDVRTTVAAYRLASQELGDYPLHLGVTEAGITRIGTVKSAMGIGALLMEGLGDTLRVSLTGDPIDEVKIGWDMLAGLELRRRGPNVISCPSCGRCDIDVVPLAIQVNEAVSGIRAPVSIAVMGCEVNGPGEASAADYGVAGGDGFSLIFKKGQKVARVSTEHQLEALMEVIHSDLGEDATKEVAEVA